MAAWLWLITSQAPGFSHPLDCKRGKCQLPLSRKAMSFDPLSMSIDPLGMPNEPPLMSFDPLESCHFPCRKPESHLPLLTSLNT